MTPTEYRAKAEELLERAQASQGNPQLTSLALSYLRLADLAEKNAGNDMSYETPTVTVPMQQQAQSVAQPMQQQQQQQKTEDDE